MILFSWFTERPANAQRNKGAKSLCLGKVTDDKCEAPRTASTARGCGKVLGLGGEARITPASAALPPSGVGIPEGLGFEHPACGFQELRPFEALSRGRRKFCSYWVWSPRGKGKGIHSLVRKKNSRHLSKVVKQTTYLSNGGGGALVIGRSGAQLQIKQRQVQIYSQGGGFRSVDRHY